MRKIRVSLTGCGDSPARWPFSFFGDPISNSTGSMGDISRPVDLLTRFAAMILRSRCLARRRSSMLSPSLALRSAGKAPSPSANSSLAAASRRENVSSPSCCTSATIFPSTGVGSGCGRAAANTASNATTLA